MVSRHEGQCFLSAFLLVVLLLALVADGAPKFCSKKSSSSVVLGLPGLVSCDDFFSDGSSIQVAPDTPTVKYGALSVFNVGSAGKNGISKYQASASFIDRFDTEYGDVPDTLIPRLSKRSKMQLKPYNQILVKATVGSDGNITAIEPILYVPAGSIMRMYRSTSFIGTIQNWNPPAGVASQTWFRWDFDPETSTGEDESVFLTGTLINMYQAVKDPDGVCQPALCSSASSPDATCQWYQRFVGQSSNLTLTWDPALLAPMDAHLIVTFSSGTPYLAGIPTMNELLATGIDVKRFKYYQFVTRSKPMGTMFKFDGSFVKQQDVIPC